MPRIDFYIARQRASPSPIRPLAFLFERRSYETAILCKSINGASTRCILPSSRCIRLILPDKYSLSLSFSLFFSSFSSSVFFSYTTNSPSVRLSLFLSLSLPSLRRTHRCSGVVKIMNFLIRRNSVRPSRLW